MEVKVKDIEKYLDYLEKEVNEAYKNSISLELIWSTDPKVMTRTSEAKRLAKLKSKVERLRFKMEMEEIESHLPDFSKMTDAEIEAFVEKDGKMMHYVPVFTYESEYGIIHEDGSYYLSCYSCAKDNGCIAIAYGTRITPRIVDILCSRGWQIIEN